MLDVGDGHHLYWEVCGNPAGKPALVLHGGSGSDCAPGHRRWFDPRAYKIVLFDQRGSGRSTPQVTATSDLSANTTSHIAALNASAHIWASTGGSCLAIPGESRWDSPMHKGT